MLYPVAIRFPPGETATELMFSVAVAPGMGALAVSVRVARFHTWRPVPPTASVPPPGASAMLFSGAPVSRSGTGRCQART